jgi:hypothetical protein
VDIRDLLLKQRKHLNITTNYLLPHFLLESYTDRDILEYKKTVRVLAGSQPSWQHKTGKKLNTWQDSVLARAWECTEIQLGWCAYQCLPYSNQLDHFANQLARDLARLNLINDRTRDWLPKTHWPTTSKDSDHYGSGQVYFERRAEAFHDSVLPSVLSWLIRLFLAEGCWKGVWGRCRG